MVGPSDQLALLLDADLAGLMDANEVAIAQRQESVTHAADVAALDAGLLRKLLVRVEAELFSEVVKQRMRLEVW